MQAPMSRRSVGTLLPTPGNRMRGKPLITTVVIFEIVQAVIQISAAMCFSLNLFFKCHTRTWKMAWKMFRST